MTEAIKRVIKAPSRPKIHTCDLPKVKEYGYDDLVQCGFCNAWWVCNLATANGLFCKAWRRIRWFDFPYKRQIKRHLENEVMSYLFGPNTHKL